MAAHVYKVFRLGEWQDFAKSAAFAGSPDDLRDGFIHLSSAPQVAGVLERYFRNETLVVIADIDAARLGAALKFEAARSGELFPHLYAALLASAVLKAERLVRTAAGFMLPGWIARAS